MPRFLSFSMVASLLLFAVPVQAQDLLQWETDLATAQKQAAATNRLVLVHFGASWCPPCKEMERQVFSKPGLGSVVSPYYVAVKLQLDGDPKADAIAKQYQVKSLPTDLIMTPQGVVVSQSLGFAPADKYAAMLNAVAQQSLAQARSNGLPPAAAAPAAPAAAAPPVSAAPVSTTPPPAAAARYAAPQPAADNRYAAYAPAVAAQVNVPPAAAPVANPGAASSSADDRYAAYYQSRGLAAPTAPATTAPIAPVAVAPSAVAASPATPSTTPDNRYATPTYTAPPVAAVPVAPVASPVAVTPVAAVQTPASNARVAAPPAAAASVATNPAPSNAAPSNSAAAAPAAASQASLESQLPPGSPPLALEGYCPVTVIDKMVWTKGSPRFGAIHLGRTYLFPTAEMQQKFLANPDRYAPIISGNDPVVALEKNEIVAGRRQHGLVYENRMILFSSRESYDKFVKESKRYTTELQQALQSSNAVRR